MPKTLPNTAQVSATNNNTLSRNEAEQTKPDITEDLFFGELRLDKPKKLLVVDDHSIRLTGRECTILELFITHPEQVLTRQQIYNQLWDSAAQSPSNTVDVHIKNLRKKIKQLSQKNYLRTVRGVGYCLSPRPVNY